MQDLRQLGARRLMLQALVVGGLSGGVIGAFRLAYTRIIDCAAAALHGWTPDKAFESILLTAALCGLALAAWALLRFEPLIGGSGIPQVELALAGRAPMPFTRVLWAKFTGTLVSLTGGLSVGREGPCIQMGAAVGCAVGRIWHDDGKAALPRYLVGGAVAGLTAAFGAPLAGLCFAFEEMKSPLSAPLALFTCLSALSAYCVVEGLFGFGLVFPFAGGRPLAVPQWWIPPLAGVFLGLLGVFYNALFMGLLRVADRVFPRISLMRVLLAFLLSGLMLFICPQVLSGYGLEPVHLEGMSLSLAALAGLFLVKTLFSCLSFASGVAGGLLMPMLAAGGMAGAFLASGLLELGLIGQDQAQALLSLGMAGLFAATVRAPLTGAALILEMTGNWLNAPAVAFCAFAAAGTASLLRSRPVYDSLRDRLLEGGIRG